MDRKNRVARPPQQERSRKMVAKLLEAAGALFLERGYDKTTTNHIAERAGVSTGSLYQFFPDKAAMLVALQDEWVAKLHTGMDAALTDAGEDVPLEVIVDRVLNIHVTLNQEPPGLLGFLLVTLGPTDQVHSPTATATIGRVEELIALRGLPMPAERRQVVTQLAVHIVSAIYYLGGPGGPANTELMRQIRQALLAYLGPLERRRATSQAGIHAGA